MIGFAALAAIVLGLRVRFERKRAEAFRGLAQTLGFVPLDDREALPEGAERFPLMNVGRRRRATSVLSGIVDGAPALVFDYRYTTQGGKNQHTHHFTVVVFLQAGRSIPDFEIAPENVLTRIGQMFGYQDIDFPDDTEFSKRYLVRGADEGRIRAAFGHEARSLLTASPGWRVEARDGAVLLTRQGGRCAIEDVSRRIEDARRIVAELTPAR